MKVRHKHGQLDTVYDVIDESARFYITAHYCAIHKDLWEPIPAAPTYRDVTGECFANENSLRHFEGKAFHYVAGLHVNEPYRVTQVELDCHGTIPGAEEKGHRKRYAFIVEKRCDGSGS